MQISVFSGSKIGGFWSFFWGRLASQPAIGKMCTIGWDGISGILFGDHALKRVWIWRFGAKSILYQIVPFIQV